MDATFVFSIAVALVSCFLGCYLGTTICKKTIPTKSEGERDQPTSTTKELAQKPLLWVRSEVKRGEHRVAITPENARRLLDLGFQICVESFPGRCFPDSAYASSGCTLVPEHSWSTSAPPDTYIVGLKELPDEVHDSELSRRHVYFAHCFKSQEGWERIVTSFGRGNGEILDLEFLTDDQGRRVAAFGRAAGVVGMALAVWQWAKTQLGQTLKGPLEPWVDAEHMCAEIRSDLAKIKTQPRVLVIGAFGRCGMGACWTAAQLDVLLTKWGSNDTRRGGPFSEILDFDIFVNCIVLRGAMPPFLTSPMLLSEGRKLSVISDVSCDATNPNNPLPVYDRITTMVDPVMNIVEGPNPVQMIAIDHLPALIPSEASRDFSNDLFDTLVNLGHPNDPVWKRARDLFHNKLHEALEK